MFGGGTTTFGHAQPTFGSTGTPTLMPANTPGAQRDFEVASPPDDSVSCLSFSPPTIPSIFLIAGSWDNNVNMKILCIVFIEKV